MNNNDDDNRQVTIEDMLKSENLMAAYRAVKANAGAPGVDGMTVAQLAPHLREHWEGIASKLRQGSYPPAPDGYREMDQAAHPQMLLATLAQRHRQTKSALEIGDTGERSPDQRQWQRSLGHGGKLLRPTRPLQCHLETIRLHHSLGAR